MACAGIYPNYALYATLRFLSAMCLPVLWVNHSVYSYELFSPKVKRLINVLESYEIMYKKSSEKRCKLVMIGVSQGHKFEVRNE